MITHLSHVSLIVKNQDEAVQWYTEKMGMEIRADITMGDFRWLTVGIPGQDNLEFTLHPAMTTTQESILGSQPPGVLATNDCKADVEALRAKGVTIKMEPEDQPWGIQAVIEDLYGNNFVMVQQAAHPPA